MPHVPGLHSNLDKCPDFTHNPQSGDLTLSFHGWAWNGSWAGHGVPPVRIRISVDDAVVVTVVANISRPGVVGTGAPNPEHGFAYTLEGADAASLGGPGKHDLGVAAADLAGMGPRTWTPIHGSPCVYRDGKPLP